MSLEDRIDIIKPESSMVIPLLCTHGSELQLPPESVELFLVKSNDEHERFSTFLESLLRYQSAGGLLETSCLEAYSVQSESDYVWEVTDDQGEYRTVDTAIDQKIKECRRRARKNGVPADVFSHNGQQYIVNFKMLTLEDSKQRRIRVSTPYWCYLDPETGFIRHEDKDSSSIERMYRYGGNFATMGGTHYMFMFHPDHSHQVDVKTSEVVQITRYPPIQAMPCELQIKLCIRGIPSIVGKVDRLLTQMIQTYSKHRELSFTFPADERRQHIVCHQIANVTRQYCVSATHTLAGNQITTIMSGTAGYVDQVYALLESLAAEQCALILDPPFTALWETQTSDCELKQVRKDSEEWKRVLLLVKKTLANAQMVSLERVQNIPLWEKYDLEKKQMSKRNHGQVNEKELFHGSRKTDPVDIAYSSKGVDFRYSSRTRDLMWGTGAYFAVDARYSDNYAHQTLVMGPNQICIHAAIENSPKKIILARVLTGLSYSYDKNDPTLTKPPQLPGGSPHGNQLYDTVNGQTHGSTVYVVYDHDKSYPAYIISYKTNLLALFGP